VHTVTSKDPIAGFQWRNDAPDCREKLLIRLSSRERAPIVPEFVLWPLGRV